MVQGERYRPYDFLKVLRNSTDGAEGIPITKESSRLLEVAYQTMVFESNQLRKGGNKRGFLKSQKRLTEEAMTALKEAYRRLYSNNSDGENVVVLNDGLDFKESSATMVEMQLNERKISNADEFAKVFHISPEMMEGGAPERNSANLAKLAVVPLMNTIQCDLNRDFLLEREKGEYYWAFDAKELLRESLLNRYRAYKIALDGNFLRTDEVRYMEDMEPLGINWIRLGLQDVLYNPQTKEIYTPNTNQTTRMGEKPLAEEPPDDTVDEARANPNHDPKNGRFSTGTKKPYIRQTKRIKSRTLLNGLPLHGDPGSVVDKVDDQGNVIQRRVYGEDGRAMVDYDTTNHGKAKAHPTGAHKHIFDYTKENPHGVPLMLDENELKENRDIIKRGGNYYDGK